METCKMSLFSYSIPNISSNGKHIFMEHFKGIAIETSPLKFNLVTYIKHIHTNNRWSALEKPFKVTTTFASITSTSRRGYRRVDDNNIKSTKVCLSHLPSFRQSSVHTTSDSLQTFGDFFSEPSLSNSGRGNNQELLQQGLQEWS